MRPRPISLCPVATLVLALVLAACGGSDSPTGPAAPSVSLTAPGDGSVVQGTVALAAEAGGADRVRFLVNDVEIAVDADAPYGASWNTASVADGAHTVEAVAEGPGGTSRDAATVTVSNGGGALPVTVSVTPPSATVETGATQQFTAAVSNATDPAVTWSVEGGAAFGTITAAGLYTAPGTLPDPASATVRATSVEDPTRSGTATVNLTASGGGGLLGAEEAQLVREGFGAGNDASALASDLVDGLVEAVFAASMLNGGTPTFTGTLTQNPSNPELWSYSAQPADRLVVNLANGASIESVIAAFDGEVSGSWEDFRDYHSNLDFTVKVPGTADLRVRSASGVPGAPGPRGATAPQGTIAYRRLVTGTLVYGGVTLQLDLDNLGRTTTDVDAPGIETEEQTTGTIASPLGQINVAAGFRYKGIFFDNNVENVTRINAGSVTRNGVTYQFQDAIFRAAYTDFRDGRGSVVSDTDFWNISGSLLADGVAIAAIEPEAPVVAGTPWPGPRPVLRLNDGQVVPLLLKGEGVPRPR